MGKPDEYPTVHCKECGKQQKATYSNPTKNNMVERKLCFDCLFWTELIEGDRSNMFVADGHHFSIHPDASPGIFQGFGGRKFTIDYFDGRQVVTHNLWHQGEVPERFKDRLPDNAVRREG